MEPDTFSFSLILRMDYAELNTFWIYHNHQTFVWEKVIKEFITGGEYSILYSLIGIYFECDLNLACNEI
jgi:hypothetical protein